MTTALHVLTEYETKTASGAKDNQNYAEEK